MPLTSIDFPFQPPRGVGLRAMTLSSAYRNSTGGEQSRAMAGATDFLRPCTAAVVLGAIAATVTGPAFAAGCSFEPQGEGRVSAIIDARSFRTDDGREVRLAGIETATAGAGKAAGAAALSALI